MHAKQQEPPIAIYRYFQDPDHADALAQGTVWISTLSACRAYENLEQGDAGEGTFAYRTGAVQGLASDSEVAHRLQLMGIRVAPNARVTLNDNTVNTILRDAFVLCATDRADLAGSTSAFGGHCVRIREPVRAFDLITDRLRQLYRLNDWALGRVQYRAREHEGLEQPGSLGFTKPLRYSSQQEVRMLWTLEGREPLRPFSLQVPRLSRLCTRIA